MTEISKEARDALRDPNTRGVMLPMTEERKEHFTKVATQIEMLLRKEFENPIEAFFVLEVLRKAYMDSHGIAAGIIVTGEAEKKSV